MPESDLSYPKTAPTDFWFSETGSPCVVQDGLHLMLSHFFVV